MRPIEFRVWHKPTQKTHFVLFFMEHLNLVFVKPDEEGADEEKNKVNTPPLLLSDCILMQFIGLTDTEGNKVFEGDWLGYHDGFTWTVEEVIFQDGAFGVPDVKKTVSSFSEFFSVKSENELPYKVVGHMHQYSEEEMLMQLQELQPVES